MTPTKEVAMRRGTFEAVAALLFLFPRTLRIGAAS